MSRLCTIWWSLFYVFTSRRGWPSATFNTFELIHSDLRWWAVRLIDVSIHRFNYWTITQHRTWLIDHCALNWSPSWNASWYFGMRRKLVTESFKTNFPHVRVVPLSQKKQQFFCSDSDILGPRGQTNFGLAVPQFPDTEIHFSTPFSEPFWKEYWKYDSMGARYS